MRIFSFIFFFSVIFVFLFLGTRYIWRRLVRDTEIQGRTRTVLTIAIIGSSVLLPIVMVIARFYPRGPLQFLHVPVYTWMGAMFYLILCLGLWDISRLAIRYTKRLRDRFQSTDQTTSKAIPNPEDSPEDSPEDMSRRLFLARASAGIAVAGTGSAVFIGRANVSGEITTPEVEVVLERLPKAMDGFRIVQLTDVHIGPILDQKFLRGLVEKTNAMKPDLVVITGDLVDGTPRIIGKEVAELGKLNSRYGSFFVTGNHEYYSGVDEWVSFLDQLGIRTLMNERVQIGDKNTFFDLVGIPDTDAGRYSPSHEPNIPLALKDRDPEREAVLLAHRPEPIHKAAKAQIGLQISGHTHGGQMWPANLIAELVHPYSTGLHHHNLQTQIYVSRGAGFWGPPMRIAAPAELPSIILTSS